MEGARVELIRIDNDGNQVGDVIATTYTSTDGNYELDLPTGVDLSGDLIVRITGTNNATMSAMVVEQAIDINPAADFVARKFIESDADLGSLELSEVVELRGQVEEFDLTADPSADIEAMLAILDSELGEFVESSVTKISTEEGDTSSIAGNYYSSAFSYDLHDSDLGQGQPWGSRSGSMTLPLRPAPTASWISPSAPRRAPMRVLTATAMSGSTPGWRR